MSDGVYAGILDSHGPGRRLMIVRSSGLLGIVWKSPSMRLMANRRSFLTPSDGEDDATR